MTRTELTRLVARRNRVPMQVATRAVDIIFASMQDALCEERRVEIRGFGTFQTRYYDGYVGMNPRCGTPVKVFPKVLPVFRAGKDMLRLLNDD